MPGARGARTRYPVRPTGNAVTPRGVTAFSAVSRGGRPRVRGQIGWSDRADGLGLRSLGALRDLELDALVLFEAAEAGGLNGGEVDEHVAPTTVNGDETETLVRVEPLHGSLRHVTPLKKLL